MPKPVQRKKRLCMGERSPTFAFGTKNLTGVFRDRTEDEQRQVDEFLRRRAGRKVDGDER